MGGPGSGNHWRWSSKGVCEQYKRIDIRYMRKRGMLHPGSGGSLSWSCGGEPAGSINYRTHYHDLELNYRVNSGGEDWEPINEHIRLESRTQPFGGSRKFFICPSCHRSCMVLYGGKYFRCRKCYNLAYASQNGDYLDRLRSKAEKIRMRLGGEALEEQYDNGFAFHIARLTGLLE